ncbi:MAG: hypothetical protein GY861_04435 [bacterium]|nr:hypothetical protein [bacterium]
MKNEVKDREKISLASSNSGFYARHTAIALFLLFFLLVLAVFVAAKPILYSVSDDAETVSIGDNVTFSATWVDEGNTVKLLVSNDSEFSECNYTHTTGCMCSSPGETNNISSCSYEVQNNDGLLRWYAQLCDIQYDCTLSDGEDTVNWNLSFDGSDQGDRAYSVAVAGDGRIYVAGYGDDLVSDSSGPDWWIKKFTSNGTEDFDNWNKSFDGSSGNDYTESVAVDSTGNFYVVGHGDDLVSDSSGYDLWIKKFSSAGIEDVANWNKTLHNSMAGNSDSARSVVVDSDDNVYVAGYGWFLVSATSGPDWWIKKFTSNGTEDFDNWNKSFDGSSGSDYTQHVSLDGDGNVYVVGYGYDLISDSSQNDWWIKKFTSNGTENVVNWNKTFDVSNQDDRPESVVVDSEGYVYVVGHGYDLVSSSSDEDWWIKKFSSNGTEDVVNWNKTFDASDYENSMYSVAVDLDDNVYVAGYGSSVFSTTSGYDWWVKKFSSNGTEDTANWNKTFSSQGSYDSDYAYSFALGGDGTVYVVGSAQDVVSDSSSSDWWIKKFTPYMTGNFTVNSAPVMQTTRIYSSTNETTDDLLGYCNATDTDADNLAYYYEWYMYDVLNQSGEYGNTAIICYQETANVSTACGGVDKGNYSWQGSGWVSPNNMNDGDWNTGSGTYAESFSNYMFINYTKPTGALNSSRWKIKNEDDSDDINGNYTIPGSCWNYDATKLLFRLFKNHGDTPSSSIYLQCNNGSWNTITELYGSSNTFYEESMWWNISGGVSQGVEQQASSILSGFLDVGQNWTLSCKATDSTSNSSWMNSTTVVIHDLLVPMIDYSFPTPDDASSVFRDFLLVNISFTEANNHTAIITLDGTNYTPSMGEDYFYYQFSLSDDNYSFSAWINDSVGYENYTETRNITLDAAVPILLTVSDNADIIGSGVQVSFNTMWYDPDDTVKLLIANNSEFTDCNYAVTTGCMCSSTGETDNSSSCSYTSQVTDGTVKWYAQVCDDQNFCSVIDGEDTLNWNKTIDGTGNHDSAYSVAFDGDGNIFVAGAGSNFFGSSNEDLWLKKFSLNGTEDAINWNKTIDGGSGSEDYLSSVAVDGDGNVYVAGYGRYLIGGSYSYDWWLKKFTSNGTEDIDGWNKSFDGSGYDQAWSVAVDADGNVYVAGYGEDLVGGSSDEDWWLKKFTSNGTEDVDNWNKMFDDGYDNFNSAYSVAVDADGNVFVVGSGIFLVGGSPSRDWWLKKYTSNGTEDTDNWNKTFDGSGDSDYAYSVAFDIDDNVYVVGTGINLVSDSSGSDWWLKKFSSNGSEDVTNWNKTFDGGGWGYAYSVAVDSDGIVYVAGIGLDIVSDSSDADWWLKKFSSNGTEDVDNWNKTFDGSGYHDYARSVAVDDAGNVFVVGYGRYLYSDSSWDDWLLKKFTNYLYGNFTVDVTAPTINFTAPTESNGTLLSRDWAYVNVSVSDASDVSAFIDWNRSLVGWWNFENVLSNGTIYDNSSYGHNGLMLNFSSNTTVSGVRGQVLEFDGVDDYINVSPTDSLNITSGEITVEGWFNFDRLNYENPLVTGGYGIGYDSSYSLDFNRDGITDSADVDILLVCYNQPTQKPYPRADVNGGDVINWVDNAILLPSVGKVGASWYVSILNKSNYCLSNITENLSLTFGLIKSGNTDNVTAVSSKLFTLSDANKWFHFAAVANGSHFLIYIDGELDGNATGKGNFTIESGALTIGGERIRYYFNGSIDEVKIWSRALTQEEINASYNTGLYKLQRNFTGLLDASYDFTAHAIDIAGNVNSTETRSVILDTVTPVTSDDSDEYYWANWSTQPVNITLTVSDSNANRTHWCVYNVGGTACTPDSMNFGSTSVVNVTCPANSACQRMIRYYSIDDASNQESTLSSNPIYIGTNAVIDNTNATNSNISDYAYIVNSQLHNSSVSSCLVSGSTINYSRLNHSMTSQYNCSIINSVVLDSGLTSATVINSFVDPTIIVDSFISYSNVTNSSVYHSRVENSTLCPSGCYLFEAIVRNNVLLSGLLRFNGSDYYGPYSIDNICAGYPPVPEGSLVAIPSVVRNNISVSFMYKGSDVGFTVSIPEEELQQKLDINATSSLILNDNGISGDQTAGDAFYTGVYTILANNTYADGNKTIIASVDDNVGNNWTVMTNVTLDNTRPSASITINQGAQSTNSQIVTLYLAFNDSNGINTCRYRNDELAWTTWESCTTERSWTLSVGNGNKLVSYEVIDTAGNTNLTNATVDLSTSWAVNILTPASNSVIRNNVTIDVTTPDGTGHVEFRFYNGSEYTGVNDSDSEDGFGMLWQTRNYASMSYNLTAIAYDLSGTQYANSTKTDISIDNEVPVLSAALPNSFQTSLTFYTQVTTNEETSCRYSFNDTGYEDMGNSLSEETDNLHRALASVASDGEYSIFFVCRDLAGNNGNESTNFTVDTTPPSLNITSPAPGSLVSGIVTINWTGNESVESYISIDGDTYIQTTTGDSHTWNTSAYLDGTHTLRIRANDSFGNTGYSGQINVEVSNAPGVIVIIQPTETIVDGNTTIEIIAPDYTQYVIFNISNSTGNYSLDGLPGFTTDSNGSNGWNQVWVTDNFADGYYNITIYAYDESSTLLDSKQQQFNVDNNAPAAPILTSLPALSTAVVLNWSYSDADTAYYNVYRSLEAGFGINPGTLLKNVSTNATTDLVVDGTYYYKITAVDEAGLESAASNEESTTISTVSIFGVLTANDTDVRDNETIKFLFTSPTLALNVSISASEMQKLDSAGTYLLLNDSGMNGDDAASDGIYSIEYTVDANNNVADGIKTIIGLANNTETIFESHVNITLDNTNPNASIEINSGDAVAESNIVMLSLAFNDSGSGIKECRYNNEGNLWTTWESCVSERAWTLLNVLGTRTVYYQIKDNAGNIEELNDSIILSVSTTATIVTILSPLSNSQVSGNTTIVVDAPDSATTVEFRIYNGSAHYKLNGSGIGGTNDTDASNGFSATWNTAMFNEGPYNISASAYDVSGVYLVNDTETNITTDNIVPSFTVYPQTTQNSRAFTIETNVTEYAECRYAFSDVVFDNMGDKMTLIDPVNNVHQATAVVASDGNYVLYFACQDPAGNQRQNSTVFSVNATAPVITASGPDGIISTPQNLTVTTSGGAFCKYDRVDVNYSQMTNSFSDDGTEHTSDDSANYTVGINVYYVRCGDDSSGSNSMDSSVMISFDYDVMAPGGTLSLNDSYVRNGEYIKFHYYGVERGLNVTISLTEMQKLDTTAGAIFLNDSGINGDNTEDDLIFSSEYYVSTANAASDGVKTIIAYVNDSAGNIFYPHVNVTLDNTDPTASINIMGVDTSGIVNATSEFTASISVPLALTFSDAVGIKMCRYANEDLSFNLWSDCTEIKPWILSSGNGNKTVHYEVMDLAGNILRTNDTIILNGTGTSFELGVPETPTVIDDGAYTNTVDGLHARWNVSGSGLTYEYRIGYEGTYLNSSWQPVDDNSEITAYRLGLTNGTNYTFEVRAINGDGTRGGVGYSDGIVVDITPPREPMVESSHSSSWSSRNTVWFNWTANDTISGINDYSFLLDLNASGIPDKVPEEETEHEILTLGANNGNYSILKFNETGNASAVFIEVNEDLVEQDVLRVTVYASEDKYDTTDEIGIRVYAIQDIPTTFNETGSNVTTITTTYRDISYVADLVDADAYSYDIVASTNVSDRFFIVVAGVTEDNNNYYDLKIAAADTSIDNTTQAYICKENETSCTNMTDVMDYAVKVQQRDLKADNMWDTSYLVGDGTFHFHVKARDNADNWGAISNYTIRVDGSAPSIPQMTLNSQYANTTSVNFNWSISTDPDSGVDNYYLEVDNDTGFTSPEVSSWRGNVTNSTVSLTTGYLYYARVRSRNYAGVNSSWSTTATTTVDTTPPTITFLKPTDGSSVVSETVTLVVMTDESAMCSLQVGAGVSRNFTFTNTTYHETRVAPSSTTPTITVRCIDVVYNQATNSTRFTINTALLPSASMITVPSKSSYTNEIVSMNVFIRTSGGTGIGDIPSSEFDLRLDGLSKGVSVADNGRGNYTITFVAPEQNGSYSMVLSSMGISSTASTLDVNNIVFTVQYLNPGLSATRNSKMIYHVADLYSVGLASDSSDSDSAGTSSQLDMISDANDGSIFIFVSKPNNDAERLEEMLQNKDFIEALSPSFGYNMKKDIYIVYTQLAFEDISLSGIERLSPGQYKLLLDNKGFDVSTNMTEVEVSTQ